MKTMRIGREGLNQLMPMHLWLSPSGVILSAGPTLQKAFAANGFEGNLFFDFFEVRRPGGVSTMADLLRRNTERLTIRPRQGAGTQCVRGQAVALPDTGGVLLNLSFGIGVIEAVASHQLTDADFAVTDLAMELLYLVEAKTAVTEELRQLNLRLQGARDVAEEQAQTDTLTGLRNRRALDSTLSVLIADKQPFGLMHIDLDYFKAVNDTLGHAAGDHVLREVARKLLVETRKGDTVARVGGDEFVVVFNDLTDEKQLSVIARRVVDRVSEPIRFEGDLCAISASIGITVSTHYDTPDAMRMLHDADEALYASKNAGRGQAQLFRGGDMALDQQRLIALRT
ncbi:GGDEF domain-containing protein [Pseudorhodobacter sp.]|uniref:GGDEF domain-containing protein n=1 Tax=Pseudorhodobacter sp. TaxID=1934400 RepID=UPI002647A963|nr:GGDEF domain-containing protein [Pseudorhodobacter sp.]MDN5788769.1 GGDEF domain-containing protein [Pseudorhodobacter sp.]